MFARIFLLPLTVALAACTKEQPSPSKTQPLSRIEAPAGAPGADAVKGDDMEALKERLARQEAAARKFELQVLEPPPPPKLPIPAPLPREREPAPPNAAAAPENRPAVAPSAPLAAAPAMPSPPGIASPPPATRRNEVAAVAPAAPKAEGPADWKLITRVEPEFPREALQARVDRGAVRARMTIDATGAVTRVEVLDSSPRRVFDRAVVRALSQWKFSGGADGRTMETEVYFHR